MSQGFQRHRRRSASPAGELQWRLDAALSAPASPRPLPDWGATGP